LRGAIREDEDLAIDSEPNSSKGWGGYVLPLTYDLATDQDRRESIAAMLAGGLAESMYGGVDPMEVQKGMKADIDEISEVLADVPAHRPDQLMAGAQAHAHRMVRDGAEEIGDPAHVFRRHVSIT